MDITERNSDTLAHPSPNRPLATKRMLAVIAFPVLLLLSLGMAAAIYWLFEHSPAAGLLGSCQGVNPPVVGVVAMLFALICAFLASEVWQRHAAASAIVLVEASAAHTLLRAASALGAPGAPLHAATRTHLQRIIDEEWPAMHAGRKTMGATDSTQKLFDLLLADPALLALPAPSRSLLHDALAKLRDARTQRLRLAEASVPTVNWVGLLLLSLLTQAAIAAVHIGQRRAMVLALVIYASGMAVAMSVVAVNDRPFAGQDALLPTALIETLQQFAPR